MTLTISAATWKQYVNKFLSVMAFTNSRMKIYKVLVTFGSADTYATNGVTANLLLEGAKHYVSVISEANSIACIVQFNKTTGKIQIYTTGTAAGDAFNELANASTLTESATFEFLVIAK